MRSTRRRLKIITLALLVLLGVSSVDAAAGSPSTTRLHVTKSSLRPGQHVGMHGRVAPASPGHTVQLQRRKFGQWRTVMTQKVNRYSRYWFSRTLHARGTYAYRVVSIKGNRLNRSVSRTVTIHVAAPPTNGGGGSCTPGYRPCIAPGPDVDCAGGSGNGPRYVQGPVYVTGSDPYGLDSDGDGVGCES